MDKSWLKDMDFKPYYQSILVFILFTIPAFLIPGFFSLILILVGLFAAHIPVINYINKTRCLNCGHQRQVDWYNFYTPYKPLHICEKCEKPMQRKVD